MCITFKALEIGSGDAFLLENGDWRCLFDAGGSKKQIVSLLNSKHINHINLAICSHNDIDHANGFLGIFASGIHVDEIWLPGLWGHIIQFVKENRAEVFYRLLEDRGCDYREECMQEYNLQYYKELFDEKYEAISIERFDDELGSLFAFYEYEYEYLHSYRLLHRIPYHSIHEFSRLALSLDRIMKIAAAAYESGCLIRWFEPTIGCKIRPIKYNLCSLNSDEVIKIKKLRDFNCFYRALSLTETNHLSLTFEYYTNGEPIIRFSADSDCTCQSMLYKNNIIITAPHHGSEANSNVYQCIKGNDIIWVRSDRKSRIRPCDTFKKLASKYCLACANRNAKSEISFRYNRMQKKWIHLSGMHCNC